MDGPLVSVIVPVYNTAAYLDQCVRSICGQTYSNLELILVDDGSTDESGRLCDRFARQDPRVHVIHQGNSGVSAARNAGLDAAKGVYVYFVDSDDWVEPVMVEQTVSTMERTGYDVCIWGYDCVRGEEREPSFRHWKEKVFEFPTPEAKRRFLCRRVLHTQLSWNVWNRSFRRGIIQRNGLRFSVGQAMAEDLDFSFRYMACCRNAYYTSTLFYHYRQRDGSAMSTHTLHRLAADMLRMILRQDAAFSDSPLFQPFYVYGGMVLAGLLNKFTENQPLEQGLAQAAGFLRSSGDWSYFETQARLAVRDRAGIRSICGWRLGGQVYSFYLYLLTGDAAAYRRANWVQTCYAALRTLKWFLLGKLTSVRKGHG